MLTQEIIESKNFTFWRNSPGSASNNYNDRDDYLGLAVWNADCDNEVKSPVILSLYNDNNRVVITDYFNDPIKYREYYADFVEVLTEDELDELITAMDFDIEEIDMDNLLTEYD